MREGYYTPFGGINRLTLKHNLNCFSIVRHDHRRISEIRLNYSVIWSFQYSGMVVMNVVRIF